jgi:hypothetical protein
MPTYKNNSKGTIIVENVDGNLVPVAPGESITTNKVISVTGMTQTASTPVYSPVVEIHEVTFTGKGDNQTVELSLGTTKYIQIKKISGILEIDLYFESTDNDPVYADIGADDPVRDIDVFNKVSQVVLVPMVDGTCQLVEYKE